MLLISRCLNQNNTTSLSNNFGFLGLSRYCSTTARFVEMPAHKLIANKADPPIGEFKNSKCILNV